MEFRQSTEKIGIQPGRNLYFRDSGWYAEDQGKEKKIPRSEARVALMLEGKEHVLTERARKDIVKEDDEA